MMKPHDPAFIDELEDAELQASLLVGMLSRLRSECADPNRLDALYGQIAAMLPHPVVEAEYRRRGLDAVNNAAQRMKDQCEKIAASAVGGNLTPLDVLREIRALDVRKPGAPINRE